MTAELTGNWVGYAADVRMVAARYQPTSMLELGCGFFIAAHAVATVAPLQRYCGIDRRSYTGQVEAFQARFPQLDVQIHSGTDIHDVDGVVGEFDLVLIDAHDGDAEQWGRDTAQQCAIAMTVRPKVVVVDDCCVEPVAAAARRAFGMPTGVGTGPTQVCWWELRA